MAAAAIPGTPVEFLNFRHQYLLTEVGTKILRNVFDHQIGPGDFKKYIDTHTAAKNQLQFLINKNKLTAVQQQLIPPIDNTPSSSNFDITLLCCLLRNACGLRVCSDQVWINPLPTDTSVEALITRLKYCRNDLMHSGSVLGPKTSLKAIWTELCSILTGLGNFCGMTNVQSLIDKAETVDIDEKLKETFDNMMSAWKEMDRLIDHGLLEIVSKVDDDHKRLEQKLYHGFETMVHEQQKTNTRLDSIEHTQPDAEAKKDIQQQLIDVYQRDSFRLPISPLFKDENQELLKIYKIPTLSVVDYHKAKADQKSTEVKSCKDIFYQDDQQCRNIYITGDAGVGKSSFCTYLSLLWSMSRKGIKVSNDRMQKDSDFLTKFDFLFYVTLRDTDRTDVIAMIVDQLFTTEREGKWNKMYEVVDTILRNHDSLVILDGLDEWSPQLTCKRDYKIPDRPPLKQCTFVTSCRPYKIEKVRLVKEDLDRQVEMTGLHGSSMKSYIAGIVSHNNEKYPENKCRADDFFNEANQCGLHELLCIPIITSNLVMIWLDQKDQTLTHMSRSLIYSNNIEMLFEIANDRNIEFPSSSSTEVQLPDSLSGLENFREHFPLLKKVGLLAFRSLFKRDDCVTNLVFTSKLLKSEPYCLSSNEQDILCKIGILSKNKVNRRFGKQEHKLSFLHKSYLEFFAAIFVSLSDATTSKLLGSIITISDVLQFENFFLFLAGISHEKLTFVFVQIYKSISDELTLCRTNAIFQYNSSSYQQQIEKLQKTVIGCFIEGSKCSNEDVNLKHEHFVFCPGFDKVCLKILLLLNKFNVKSLQASVGKYLDDFNQINTLQCLYIGHSLSIDYAEYDEKFNELMVQNKSTLLTVCVHGGTWFSPFLNVGHIPVENLDHLTSLCLYRVQMNQTSLRTLGTYLADNVLLEHIKLYEVRCYDWPRFGSDDKQHEDGDASSDDDGFIFNLQNHTKLISLCLYADYISCGNINKSSLRYVTLGPFPKSGWIAKDYSGVLNCLEHSDIEHLGVNTVAPFDIEMSFIPKDCGEDRNMLDENSTKTLTTVVKTLPCIKSLCLYSLVIPSDVLLELHPDVKQVEIKLGSVSMSRQCFRSFIESVISKKSVIKVELLHCQIISSDGESQRELSDSSQPSDGESDSFMTYDIYIYEFLSSIPTIEIIFNTAEALAFKTTGFH